MAKKLSKQLAKKKKMTVAQLSKQLPKRIPADGGYRKNFPGGWAVSDLPKAANGRKTTSDLLESEDFWLGLREGFLVCAGYWLRNDECGKYHFSGLKPGETKTFKQMTDQEFEGWFTRHAWEHIHGNMSEEQRERLHAKMQETMEECKDS